MTLLTRATQVGRAVKNVGRMREIAGAMTRFGFGTLVERLGLKRFVPGSAKPAEGAETLTLPVRVRLLAEQLGPTFIKVGQTLAGRPDLVPEDWVRELSKLQDKAAPVPFTVLKPRLELELGRPLADCFSSFDTEPLASASIAQVHAARTLRGDDVVVKIQKPDVDRVLTQDLEILEMLFALGERYIAELKPFRPTLIVDEFKRTILSETDFQREAQSIHRFRENFSDQQFLVVPKVYTELSSARVLTLERLRGVKLQDVEAVKKMGVDVAALLREGMDCFFKTVMVDGFFHADPHGGNILVLPDGRMGLIDFGSVGWLSQRSKDAIINMFLALITEDYDSLVSEYLLLSPASGGTRTSSKIEVLQTETAKIIGPYHGLPLKDIPAGKILMEATNVAFRHHISLPRDLVLVFRAIVTLEGIGRALDPNFDLTGAAAKYAKQILKSRYDPKRLLKESLVLGRDVGRFLHSAPRQSSEILRQLENGELKLHVSVPEIERAARLELRGSSRIAFAILSVGLMISAAYASTLSTLPWGAHLALWAVALISGGLCFLKNFRA